MITCLCCNSVFVRYDACYVLRSRPTILLESLPFNLSTMNSDTETSGSLARHRGLTWRFPKRVKQRLRKFKIATHLVPTASKIRYGTVNLARSTQLSRQHAAPCHLRRHGALELFGVRSCTAVETEHIQMILSTSRLGLDSETMNVALNP